MGLYQHCAGSHEVYSGGLLEAVGAGEIMSETMLLVTLDAEK